MNNALGIVAVLISFLILSMASRQIGALFARFRLPLDVLILSIRRGGSMLVSHGYARLQVGGWVTVVGSPESLEIVMHQFEGVPSGMTVVP